MLKTMLRLKQRFQDDEAREPSNVAAKIAEQLETFKMHIPLLKALTNTRLQRNHWSKISEIVGFAISPKDNAVSWTNLKDQGALTEETIAQITVLSTHADRDYDQVVFKDYVVEMDDDREKLCVDLAKDNEHPWVPGGCWVVDKEKLGKKLSVIKSHLSRIGEICTSENGEDYKLEAETLKEDYEKVEKLCVALEETHSVWTALIHDPNVRDGGGNRDRAHQISAADLQWRDSVLLELEDFGEEEEEEESEEEEEEESEEEEEEEEEKDDEEEKEVKEEEDGFNLDKDSKGEKVRKASPMAPSRELFKPGKKLFGLIKNDSLLDKVVEVRDVLLARKKGDDTRKLFRRISRRASAVIKITGGGAWNK